MHNLRTFGLLLALPLGLALAACDEGDIEASGIGTDTGGRVAKLHVNISGTDTWSSQYNVVLAAFGDDIENVISQKNLPQGAQGDITLTMQLTSPDIVRVGLCVTNRLRQPVDTFFTVPVTAIDGDTLRLEAGSQDVGMFQTIQTLVFSNTCARCHGLAATAAAGLTLAQGESYAALVGHAANNPANGIRVVPGSASESLLHKVILGDASAGISFDHSNMIKEERTITLIDNWINAGARP